MAAVYTGAGRAPVNQFTAWIAGKEDTMSDNLNKEEKKDYDSVLSNVAGFIVGPIKTSVVKKEGEKPFVVMNFNLAIDSKKWFSEDKIKENPALAEDAGKNEFINFTTTDLNFYKSFYNGSMKEGSHIFATNCVLSVEAGKPVDGKDQILFHNGRTTRNSVTQVIANPIALINEGFLKDNLNKDIAVQLHPFGFKAKEEDGKMVFSCVSAVADAEGNNKFITLRAVGENNIPLMDALRKCENSNMVVNGKLTKAFNSKGEPVTVVDISGGELGSGKTFTVVDSSNQIKNKFDSLISNGKVKGLAPVKEEAAPVEENEFTPAEAKPKRGRKKAAETAER